jgi:hypothetical protein
MKKTNNMKNAINEMLNDFDFMDKLTSKECNEIFLASVDDIPKVSLKIINKWEKHNGIIYDRFGRVDPVCEMFGILA